MSTDYLPSSSQSQATCYQNAEEFKAAVVAYYQQRRRPDYGDDLPQNAAEWHLFWEDLLQEIQEVDALFHLNATEYAALIQEMVHPNIGIPLNTTSDPWHKLVTYRAEWTPRWPHAQKLMRHSGPQNHAPSRSDWQQIHMGMCRLRDQAKICFLDNSDAALKDFAQQRFTSLKEFYDFRREIEYAFYIYENYSAAQQYTSQKFKHAYQQKLLPQQPFILTLPSI